MSRHFPGSRCNGEIRKYRLSLSLSRSQSWWRATRRFKKLIPRGYVVYLISRNRYRTIVKMDTRVATVSSWISRLKKNRVISGWVSIARYFPRPFAEKKLRHVGTMFPYDAILRCKIYTDLINCRGFPPCSLSTRLVMYGANVLSPLRQMRN